MVDIKSDHLILALVAATNTEQIILFKKVNYVLQEPKEDLQIKE
jgi:hypothetical protein